MKISPYTRNITPKEFVSKICNEENNKSPVEPFLHRSKKNHRQVNVNLGQLQFRQHNVTAVPKEVCWTWLSHGYSPIKR